MKGKFKSILITFLVVVLLAGGATAAYFWYDYTHYVSTDDAQLAADFIKVTPLASGKLLEFNVKEGDYVVKDQLLGRIDADATDGAASNLRAPISGRIVEKTANVGEFESSLQAPTLALIMDPEKIYVSADVDETEVDKIKIGQPVDITIDQFKGKKFTGNVRSIGQAADAAFSFLPAQTSGTFTKVVQRVIVKIAIDKTDLKLLPGTNAVVKIRIK
jgi:multidrug resistance efflux pump